MRLWFFFIISIVILSITDLSLVRNLSLQIVSGEQESGSFFVYAAGKEPQDIIIFKNQGASRKKAEMPPARFSHSIHNKKKLKCNNCHPSVFKEKIGANIVTMKKNVDGEYCGKCHNGQSAWDMSACRRCHV